MQMHVRNGGVVLPSRYRCALMTSGYERDGLAFGAFRGVYGALLNTHFASERGRRFCGCRRLVDIFRFFWNLVRC